ncbi:MAG: glycosyltransferase, partial [Chloroflexota bacterium]
ADAYASADAFMFTGANETFGQVVQEAMASGLPAIIIDQGGITDQVIPGENGYICPADPQAFAAAARRLCDDPGLRRQMSINARRCAEKRPWDVILSELETHYAEAIQMNERFDQVFPADWRLNFLTGNWKHNMRRLN